MAIWEYDGQVEDKELVSEALLLKNCPFCVNHLFKLIDKEQPRRELADRAYKIENLLAEACSICGWWRVSRSTIGRSAYTGECSNKPRDMHHRYGAIPHLRNLDISDISIPVSEVRDFLTAKYESRYKVHPRLFEETVASVFHDHGYHAKVTAYSGDGGIDVVLDGKRGEEIGVQVKRYKGSISVEQIRAFTGALLIGGYTKGIFVTTSRFQAGANKTARLAELRGIRIELMDAEMFYDALKIAQRTFFRSKEDLQDQLQKHNLIHLESSYLFGS